MLPTTTDLDLPKSFKTEEFFELICRGFSETAALQAIGYPRESYLLILLRHQEFNNRLREAFKMRAEVWHGKIVEKASTPILDPKEVPGAKLQFEQLKYLAEKDDPDRFGDKKKIETSVDISITDFRNMSDKQAQQILTNNPFAQIEEAEFTEVKETVGSGEEAL